MIRSGREYLESLADGREVWLAGERITDVVGHPDLQGCARSIAGIYDLQGDPAYRAALTMAARDGGERDSLAFLVPRTPDDLRRRRAMIELLARRNGGTLGRPPDYVPLILLGLLDQQELLVQADPRLGRNTGTYFEVCRDGDLCISHSFADPQIDRARPSGELNYLHAAGRTPEGIVVRGFKTVATLAPLANEYLVLTPPRAGIIPAQVLMFAVPVASPGLRLVCREPFSRGGRPLSSHFDEIDAWAAFDDVLVPWERVFLLDDVATLRKMWRNLNAWAYYHLLVRSAVKAELFVGVCTLVTKQIGTRKFQNVIEELAEVVRYLETLRSFLAASETGAVTTRSGLCMPAPGILTVAHMYAIEHHPRLLQSVMRLSGQSLLMAPGPADLDRPELRETLREPFRGRRSRT